MREKANRINPILTRIAVLALLVAASFAGVATAHADDREREQMRRLQQAQQKLSADNRALQQEKSRLEQEKADALSKLKVLTEELQRAEEGGRATRARLTRAEKEQTQTAGTLTELQRTYADLDQRHKLTSAALTEREAEVKHLQAQLAEQRQTIGRQVQSIQSCEDKNLALYQMNTELMARYRSFGLGEALMRAEPFTGLKAVETENLLREYRDKLDSQKVAPATVPK